ncbi:MAG: hypothetical protein ACYDC3_18585 [Candidatus Binataceae bacterium]
MRFTRSSLGAAVSIAILMLSTGALAQWAGRDGWVEEPDTKSLNAAGGPGHAYLDSTSVHRTDDGLIHFNESSNVSRPADIGKVGLMEDAYDCAANVKYMCVDHGDWRNDPMSKVNLSHDPALPIYRKYLCGDGNPAASAATTGMQP